MQWNPDRAAVLTMCLGVSAGCGAHGGLPDDDDDAVDIQHVPCMETVHVPEGSFTMGIDEPVPDWLVNFDPELDCPLTSPPPAVPAHEVRLSDFWIQRFESTARCFAQCVEAGACAPISGLFVPDGYGKKPSHADRPIGYVHFSQARDYCAFRGGLLPTEAQWEMAARSPEDWAPTMEDIACDQADVLRAPGQRCTDYDHAGDFEPGEEEILPLPIPERPRDESPFGVRGVLGGVREWVRDRFDPTYYLTGGPPWVDPIGPAAESCALSLAGARGTSFHTVRTSLTTREPEVDCRNGDCTGGDDIGFRCVWEAGPPTNTE